METLSSRSLARVLSDIAVVFSSGDDPEERLKRALELLRDLVPYSECALLTLQPQEVFLAWPPRGETDALRDIVRGLLSDLRQGEGHVPAAWPRWNSHLAVPLVNPDVQIVGLLLLVRDAGSYDDLDLRVLSPVAGQLASFVTWLQYREERADLLVREQAARDEADRANRAKDAFLATLSHELRSPLNAIVGWSDMLIRGALPPDTVRRALQAIHRNARTQAHLIEDVLDVSRIISGKLRIEKQLGDLTTVVQAAVEAIRPVADAKGVELTADLPASPMPLLGDATRLQQVVSNLLSNAVKFTPQGGHIRVSLARFGDEFQVQVQDSGIGIDREALPRVFDRFFQHDSSLTRRHTGLGLGLAIVKHIVEQHGGAVHVNSEGEGKGSSFTVTLRADTGMEPAATMVPFVDPTAGSQALRLDGLSVLVVDDESETRDLVGMLLGERGAAVTVAASADEALSRIAEAPPDMIIADIAMPEKDGLTLIRDVRERGLKMPAIALSAHGRGDDRTQATAAGFNLHLVKPVLPGDLVAVVGALARRSTSGS